MKKHIFKAGNYVIGDPCYFIADENWDKVLEDTGFFGSSSAFCAGENFSQEKPLCNNIFFQ